MSGSPKGLPKGLPPPGTVICRMDEIEEPGSRGFTFGEGRDAFRMFLVRSEGRVTGWLNRCPHAGAPLNWHPDQFLSLDRKYIICTVHFAMFRPDDGSCVAGPCRDRGLWPVPVEVTGGDIRIAPQAATEPG